MKAVTILSLIVFVGLAVLPLIIQWNTNLAAPGLMIAIVVMLMIVGRRFRNVLNSINGIRE